MNESFIFHFVLQCSITLFHAVNALHLRELSRSLSNGSVRRENNSYGKARSIYTDGIKMVRLESGNLTLRSLSRELLSG
ncbi:hypothetical protein AB3S75_003859 [Citrus x aurantiifolia]